MKSVIKWFKCSFFKEYLKRSKVAELLKCDVSTELNWTQKGKLVKFCTGNKSYYKRSEVKALIKKI
jgi:hypothetical protein